MILIAILVIFIVVLITLGKCRQDNFQSTTNSNKDSNNAILVVSIGNRSHLKNLRMSQQDYANRCGAHFHLVEYPSLSSVPLDIVSQIDWYQPKTKEADRYRARMLKMIFLREALRNWDRILLLDDTCYVDYGTPNLFNIVPMGELGVAQELGELRHCTKFNSGVLLCDRSFLGVLNNIHKLYQETNKAIREGTFEWCGVDQTILNYATDKYHTQIFYLDPRFNLVSSRISNEIIQNGDAYIYHLTGTNIERTIHFAKLLTTGNLPT